MYSPNRRKKSAENAEQVATARENKSKTSVAKVGEPDLVADELVVPTMELTPLQRKAFDQARDSRPGFWTKFDAYMLTMMACSVVKLEEMMMDPDMSIGNVTRQISQVNSLCRALGLSPYSRRVEARNLTTTIIPPKEEDKIKQDDGSVILAPWRRGSDQNKNGHLS